MGEYQDEVCDRLARGAPNANNEDANLPQNQDTATATRASPEPVPLPFKQRRLPYCELHCRQQNSMVQKGYAIAPEQKAPLCEDNKNPWMTISKLYEKKKLKQERLPNISQEDYAALSKARDITFTPPDDPTRTYVFAKLFFTIARGDRTESAGDIVVDTEHHGLSKAALKLLNDLSYCRLGVKIGDVPAYALFEVVGLAEKNNLPGVLRPVMKTLSILFAYDIIAPSIGAVVYLLKVTRKDGPAWRLMRDAICMVRKELGLADYLKDAQEVAPTADMQALFQGMNSAVGARFTLLKRAEVFTWIQDRRRYVSIHWSAADEEKAMKKEQTYLQSKREKTEQSLRIQAEATTVAVGVKLISEAVPVQKIRTRRNLKRKASGDLQV